VRGKNSFGRRIRHIQKVLRILREVPVTSQMWLFIGFLSTAQLHNEAWTETMAADGDLATISRDESGLYYSDTARQE
jgi:hypothetical protein